MILIPSNPNSTSPRLDRSGRRLAVTALVLTFTAFTARAADVTTPIAVPNFSFESPTKPAQTSTNTGIAPGWVFDVKGGSKYGTMAIAPKFTSPGTSDGNNCAFINNDTLSATDTITSAASLGTITPMTQYTLTVAIGNVELPDSDLYGSPGNVEFSLLADGKAIASKEVGNGTVPNGTFEDFSLTYASPKSGSTIGDDLTIQLKSLEQVGGEYTAAFDNITLDGVSAAPVPEPHGRTLAMITFGALALCLVRRHRIP
jgi:hypothetical protein